jgi:hypothetical protein
MTVSIPHQLVILLCAAGFGAAIGALYDIFRIIRISVKHCFFAVFIEDAFVDLFFCKHILKLHMI